MSRAILRSACFEIHECIDVPPKVIINEYVNISKSFFSEKEPSFINGILDSIAKIYRKDENNLTMNEFDFINKYLSSKNNFSKFSLKL